MVSRSDNIDEQYKRLENLLKIFKNFGRNKCKIKDKRVIQIKLNKWDDMLFYVLANDEVCVAGLSHDKKKVYPEESVLDYLYNGYSDGKFSIDAFEKALFHNS